MNSTFKLSSDQERALRTFFEGYFYADRLEHSSDLNQALEDYLTGSPNDDPNGRHLLAAVEVLITKDPAEEELVRFIETDWELEVESSSAGFTYGDVLRRMHIYLQNK